MRLIKKMIHPDVKSIEGNIFERKAARAIIMRGSEILLLYTKRYNDYSFPGGGLELNEDLLTGLKREIIEETGATNLRVQSEFGCIEEYRPHYKPDFDLVHMISYYFMCTVDKELGNAKLEDYEITNGMTAVWIDINEAIKHNRQVIRNQEESMGLSIERETTVLELIVQELINRSA
ncbi:NUDIX domain-containing protein [Paenibacillus sp. Cedars]|nr:NUDIX hydrolase [Paenibacillus sp. Cedars]AWP25334.1 DNA mismatch repair protein MutT [Paenibacillus sp. Cedars]MBX4148566.1 NUDIX domain-containing protein [Paenibacillus lautus]